MSVAALLDDPDLRPVLEALPRARIVGGAVRDALAGRPVADIDLATPDDPASIMTALERAGLRAIPTGLSHGTVTAISNHRPFEITTLRRDVRTDGRHAETAWTSDWREDAARRDFTINAMSLERDGTIHDHFGGRADLAGGRVRFVGEAAQRIAEDYLRALRFFRFFARFGSGAPDSEAVEAITEAAGRLPILSAERVWSEFKRILAAPDPRRAIALMQRTGVLGFILPDGADLERLSGLIGRDAPADAILRLASLMEGEPLRLADRLKLSAAESERLGALRAGPLPGSDDPALRRALADLPADILIGRSWLDPAGTQAARDRLGVLERPVFPVGGRDALALGVPPGPEVGRALQQVRAWWLEGGCAAGAEACRDRLAEALGRAIPAEK